MLLLGLRNIAEQDLQVSELVNLGSVYRKYCKKDNGINTYTATNTSISLNKGGVYHVTATAIVSAPAEGNVTLSLYSNGNAIDGATATETIATATTEFHTLVIDTFILVNTTCTLGIPSIETQNLTLINTGVASTISNVVVNIDKVL